MVGIAALESMGVHDVDPSETSAAASIARDAGLTERDRRILLAAVREMQREHTNDQQAAPPPHAEGRPVAGPPQPGGVTGLPLAATSERTPYPWEEGDFDLAAKRGRNRGRELREQQDRDAEGGGA